MEGSGSGIVAVGRDPVDEHVELAILPAAGHFHARNDSDAALGSESGRLDHRALGIVIADRGNAEVVGGKVLDQRGGGPGAVTGVGVEMKIDRIVGTDAEGGRTVDSKGCSHE